MEEMPVSSSSQSTTHSEPGVALSGNEVRLSTGMLSVGEQSLEDEGTVLDSGIVPFFDTNDGNQIIFKGILDSNGAVILDPSFLMSGITIDGIRDGNFSFATISHPQTSSVVSSMITKPSEEQINDNHGVQNSDDFVVTSTQNAHHSAKCTDKTFGMLESNTLHGIAVKPREGHEQVGPSQSSFKLRPNLPIIVSEDIEPPIGKGPHVCSDCGKTFLKWAHFKRHKAEHLDEKSFRCSVCSMSFNYESNLTLHTMIHDAEANGSLECKMCPAKFSRMASLKSHVRVHEKEENLVCTECGDEFATEVRLQNHLDEHNTSNTKSLFYRCKLCGKSFNQSALLKDHSKEHVAVRNQLKILHPLRKKPVQPKVASCNSNSEKPQGSQMSTSITVDQPMTKAKQRKDLKKKLTCSVCSKRFEKPSQLSRHMRIHTGEKPFECPHCQRSFNQKCTLESHILSMHDKLKPYICHLCNSSFSQRGNLKAHVLKVHVPPGNDVKYFKCEECPCVYKRIATLNAHIAKLHTKSRKPTLSETSNHVNPSEVSDENHSSIPDPKSVTGSMTETEHITEKNTSNDHRHEMIVNETIHTAPHTPLSKHFKLPQKSPSTLADHTLQEQFGNERLEDETTEVSIMHESGGTSKKVQVKVKKIGMDKWYLCPFHTCSKSFKKPSDLVRHIRVHTQEKPFSCDKCGKSFAVKSTLRTHSKTHSETKDWECRVCRKQFSVLNSLRTHERLHTGAKPFHCSQCSKCFRTSSQRRMHLRAHARNAQGLMGGRRVKLLRIGENQPTQKLDLPDPLRITSDGDLVPVPNRTSGSMLKVTTEISSEWTKSRPYKCTQCPSAFKKSSHLKQHLRSHTGDRPYKCFQCYRNFISSGVLKNHIKTHEGVRAHKCTECQLTFTTNGSLKRHMVSVHSELRSYVCPYCHKTFKTSVQCRKHIKTHRNELLQIQVKKESIPSQSRSAIPSKTKSGVVPVVYDTLAPMNTSSNLELEKFTENADSIIESVVSSADIVPGDKGSGNPMLHQETHPGGDSNLMNLSSVMDNEQNTESLQIQEINDLINDGPNLSSVTSEDVTQYSLQSSEVHEAAQNQLSISLADGQTYDGTIFTLQNGSINLAGTLSQIMPATSHVASSCPSTSLNVPESSDIHNAELEYATDQTVCDASLRLKQLCGQGEEDRLRNDQDNENMSQMNINVINMGEEPNIDMDGSNIVTIVTDGSGQEKGKVNVCSHCGRGFKKRSDLLRHFRIHTGEKPFKCHICGKEFRVKSTRESHLRTHEGGKSVSCNICHNMFSTKSSLNVHLRLHTGIKPYKCPHCDKHFRTSGHRKAHQQWHIRAAKDVNKDLMDRPERSQNHRILPPVQTIKGKSSSNRILVHQTNTKQEENSAVDEALLTGDVLVDQSSVINSANGTSICYVTTGGADGTGMLSETTDPMQIVGSLQLTLDSGLPNVQITGLDLNTLQLSDEFLQSLGNVIFMTQPHQSNTISSQNDPLSGSMMGQTISVLTGKDLNIGSTAMVGNQSVTSFGDLESVHASNNELVHGFINSPMLSSVIVDHKSQNNSDERITAVTPNNKMCSICGKQFAKPFLLKRHMTTHTGEKPFKCKECGCAFNQKTSLDIHMFTHGDDDKRPFACAFCPFRTVLRTALKKHCQRAHKDVWNDSMASASKSTQSIHLMTK